MEAARYYRESLALSQAQGELVTAAWTLLIVALVAYLSLTRKPT